jgi:hypothetical protein
MATLFVDKVDPQSGTSLEIGSSGDTITIPSGATITNSGTATGFGITAGQGNDPSFHAYNPQNGTVASGTNVVVSNNTELFDSSSAYDTTTYKFTPQVAGFYFLYANVRWQTGDSQFDRIDLTITKNGSTILAARNSNEDYTTCGLSGIVQANGSSDYFQMNSYHNKGSSMGISTEDEYVYFGGFLIKKS